MPSPTFAEATNSQTKTALITGASSGLGAEFACQLAALGYRLALTARRQQRLEELAAELNQKYGAQVEVIPADLSISEGIARVEQYIASLPSLDLLINNAGFGNVGSFARVDPAKHDAMVQVHVAAVVRLTRAALPGMIARQRGDIINVASMAGIVPIRSTLYGTTKSFLINFSTSLQYELRGKGVYIQALCPGFTVTEFHETPEYHSFRRTRIPRIFWLTSEQVVRDSLSALSHHKLMCIPGFIYRLVAVLSRFSPTASLIQSIGHRWLRKN